MIQLHNSHICLNNEFEKNRLSYHTLSEKLENKQPEIITNFNNFSRNHPLRPIQINAVKGILEMLYELKTSKIFFAWSVENEVCLYRKSGNGVSMLAIDEEGEILFNYTGYEKGLDARYFQYNEAEVEDFIYLFLSR